MRTLLHKLSRDYLALGHRLFKPSRGKLPQVLEWLSSRVPHTMIRNSEYGPYHSIPEYTELIQEAWETFAPEDWIGNSQRVFYTDHETLKDISPAPNTLQGALTMVSDPEGVLAAEYLAYEVASRLEPWGVPQPARIIWRCIDPATGVHLIYSRLGLLQGVAERAFDLANPTDKNETHRIFKKAAILADAMERRSPDQSEAVLAAFGMELWLVACQRGYRVPDQARGGYKLPTGPIGKLFSELPNPYTPFLDIIEKGYLIESINARGIVLLALGI